MDGGYDGRLIKTKFPRKEESTFCKYERVGSKTLFTG
jgi:hypothetical protein